MALTSLSPCFGPAFWAAFGVDPPAGNLLVPAVSGEGVGIRREALIPSNADAFSTSALRVIGEFQALDANALKFPAADGEESWALQKAAGEGAVRNGLIASGPEGRHVQLFKVETRGSEKSLKVEAGIRRPFSQALLKQAVTVERNHCHLVAVYEIRFEGSALRGVREFLKLPPQASLQELAAQACLTLDVTGLESGPQASLVRKKGRREERSAAGTASEGQNVILIWSSQPRAGGGGIDEDLVLYVHASRESSALPPRAVGFWNLIEAPTKILK